MNINIGFIGTGYMGTAMVEGIVKTAVIRPENVRVYDIDKAKTGALNSRLGVAASPSVEDVVEKSDVIILAVKPNVVKPVLESCRPGLNREKILISIAAGIPLKTYTEAVGSDRKIIRAIPNTPAVIGEGMTLISFDKNINDSDLSTVKAILGCMSKVEILDEKLMSEVIALTSSSPAYVFMFIEAMADAAVLSGIPRNLAYKLAAQAVQGSARMVLETGKHPGELKDQVCSPAGTTIEAVKALEKNGFRYSVMNAMEECTRRARELGKI